MKPLFINFLFTLSSLLTVTVGFPLRYVGYPKDLSIFGEKRTPVLCWVVHVHSGFKCHPDLMIQNLERFQDDNLLRVEREGVSVDERNDDGKYGSSYPTCAKQHFKEIAKEVDLVIVHVFSRFSNDVLMCHLEDEGLEKMATLSRIHHLHPGFLKEGNETTFLKQKNMIEDRLHSHPEIVSFHSESIHQRKQRINIPRKFDESVIKTSVPLPFSLNKDLRTLDFTSSSLIRDLCFSLNHSSCQSSSNSFQRGWDLNCLNCNKWLSVFHEKCFGKNFQNNQKILKNNIDNLDMCNDFRNALKSSQIVIGLLQNLCNETKSSSICRVYSMDVIRNVINESFYLSSLLPNSSMGDISINISNILHGRVQTVIKSLTRILCYEIMFHPGVECSHRHNQSSTNNRSAIFSNDIDSRLCVHCQQHSLQLLFKTNHTVSSSNFYDTLFDFYKRIIILYVHQIIPEFSLDSSTVKNDLRESLDQNIAMKSVFFKAYLPAQQLLHRNRRKLSSSSSSSLSSSSTLYKIKARKRRSSWASASSSPIVSFNDPAFHSQWHLHNAATPHMDVNVTGVWVKGYNGSGVTVAVVDDGLQWQNDDLKANYEYRGSWDFNDDDPDPTPSTSKAANHHGTRCAGEIAAVANNSLCGVGVAFGAKVAGIRVLDGVMTDSLEAEAFNKGMEINDIYSCSWGPDDDGKTVDGPHLMAARAMRHGIEFGRHGYGSIFVVASGNGGLHKDNCNFDGYANSIYTVTIGAVDESGLMPYYAEECASMLGVTFSSGTINKRDIVTTDWTYQNPSGCTEKHTGTSAAAPLAAGMIALMLQARPCLTWRDVQYLIILTAKKVDVDLAHWQKNGAGLSHSHKHGFGLLSSWRMVNAARVWRLVPWMTSYSRDNNLSGGHFDIPKKGGGKKGKHGGSSLLVWDMVGEEDVRGYSLFTLESVQVTISLSHPYRGKLSIKLISPSKTASVIAAPRPNDNSSSGFQDWTFTTVRCWGESPIGNWTLIISDTDHADFGNGRLSKWRLRLFGTPMSRSEFDERRRLVESAMGGQYLSPNHSVHCPPPPHKTEMVHPFSDRTLKILILCGIFCLVMAVYETFEYMCCYGDEKKEYQQEVEQMRLARRVTERTLRALENEHQSAIPMTADSVANSGRRDGARTINNLNDLSPNLSRFSLRRSRRDRENDNIGGNQSNRNENRDIDCNDNNNDDDGEEDDLFDAAETSGLLRRFQNGHGNSNNSNDNSHHPSSSLSFSSSVPSSRISQTKTNSITQSIKNGLGRFSSLIGFNARNRNNDRYGIEEIDDVGRNLVGNEDDDDDEEDDIFDSSLSRNPKLLTINTESISLSTRNETPSSQSECLGLELEMTEMNSNCVVEPSP